MCCTDRILFVCLTDELTLQYDGHAELSAASNRNSLPRFTLVTDLWIIFCGFSLPERTQACPLGWVLVVWCLGGVWCFCLLLVGLVGVFLRVRLVSSHSIL